VLIAPFLTMVALGGFVNLNLVIMWSFMAPLGALVMADRTSAGRWFIAYLALLGLLVALQPHLRTGNNLPPVVALANGMVALSGTAISTFFLLNYFVAQRNLFQEKADNLLLNILPEEIAAILKEENRTIAEHYDGVSVLFADVVGFTPMSAEMTPIELVELLNEVFSHFDSLVGKYGLEKIKTIGDCYMVASGVPRPRPDHAQALTSLALDIRDYASEHEIKGRRIAFRIGINSGSVVAGVIGRRKFIYDLWGDAVNTASRMESHGAGGAVQITESTYELIKHDFACETRGILKVKGKGDMKVWHILGRKGQTLPDGTAAVT
jgi:guanylate cyclase